MGAQSDNAFLGTGWSFPPQFSSKTGTIDLVAHDKDIQQSLRILFSTSPGERVMHPQFGCNLKKQVFDTISQGTITKIKDSVRRAILFFEPRITLHRVDVVVEDDPQHVHSVYNGFVVIHVDYTIRQTNSRSNLVYPFYFMEADNI